MQPILGRSPRANSGAILAAPLNSRSRVSDGENATRQQDAAWDNQPAEPPAIVRLDRNLDGRAAPRTGEQSLSGCNWDGVTGLYPTVVTFDPHPQEFFTGQPKQLLTPLPEKVELLKAMGVEQLILLPFDRELADLTADEFVEKILVRQLQANRISVGMDFRFGRGRAGTAADLQSIASRYGIDVTLIGLHTCDEGDRISSSIVRESLASGDLKRANQLLGRPYSLVGSVVSGQRLGRTIGFPTANIELPPEKFLPRFGVYAVQVFVKNEAPNITSQGSSYEWKNAQSFTSTPASDLSILNGVMNVGCRPTVDGKQPTIEIHLLDWSGDLYGQTLSASLVEFLRPEQKFASLDALKTQIQADCDVARKVL